MVHRQHYAERGRRSAREASRERVFIYFIQATPRSSVSRSGRLKCACFIAI
jgi:hypothetical protein